MENLIKPIKPRRVSDQVFEQLRDLIFRGRLRAGEKLLPERELAQALGVSRPTLREAINKLVSLGLVEHRQGQGTFVGLPAGQNEKNPLAALINGHEPSLEELLEVRLGLECQAAVLAAQRATEQDLAAIATCLDDMPAEPDQGRLGIEADVAFHMAIAYAAQNLAQVHILRTLYDLLHFGFRENLHHLYTQPGNLEIIDAHHQAVYTALRQHDPDAAFAAMKKHITFVLDFVRGSYTKLPPKR
jgi:GntR family transcriptional regulator, transcriptional repressor for pyruvate dehydrogenase complex